MKKNLAEQIYRRLGAAISRHGQFPRPIIALALALCGGGLAVPLASAAYDPSYVTTPSLKVWLRADSLAVANGAAVSTWADQSGNGNDATQLTSTNQPTYVTGVLNGLPVVRFTSASPSYMTVPSAAAASSNNSILIVVKTANGNPDPAILLDKYTTTGFSLKWVNAFPAYIVNSYAPATGTSSGGLGAGGLLNGFFYVVEGHFPGDESRSCDMVLNGTVYSNSAGLDPNNLSIGSNTNNLSIGGLASGSGLQGDIAEILVYGTKLNIDQRRDIEAYFYAKYGLGVKPTLPTPKIIVHTGSTALPQTVTISAPAGATIYYTLDGSVPTTSSSVYTGPLSISAAVTIKAKAVKAYENDSLVDTTTGYLADTGLMLWLKADMLNVGLGGIHPPSIWKDSSINGNDAYGGAINQPSLIPNGLNGNPVVGFSSNATWGINSAMSIYYPANLDLNDNTVIAIVAPAAYSVATTIIGKYTSGGVGYSLKFTGATSAKYFANSTNTVTATVAAATPVLLEGLYDSGAKKLSLYANGVPTAISTGTAALSNSNGLVIGDLYNGNIAELMVYNRAISDEERKSIEAYVFLKYAVGASPAASSPLFNLPTGTYASAQVETLSTPSGGTIYYTLDGSTPTINSMVYTGPITISQTATLKAIVIKNGYSNSPVWQENITIDPSTNFVTKNGLQAWFRADSITQTNGTAISVWEDQSGNSNDLTQGTAANRPILSTVPTISPGTLNGKPIVHFNAASKQYLSATDNPGLSPAQLSIVVIGRYTNTAATFVDKFSGTSAGYSLRTNTTAKTRIQLNAKTLDVASSPNTYYIFTATYDQVNSKIFINGGLLGTQAYASPITNTSTPLYVGGRSTSNNLDGDIAEVLIYNRALTDNERYNLESYVYGKYGVGITHLPLITLISGGQQYGQVNQFNLMPFDVAVWDSSGTIPIVNTALSLTVNSGGGQLSTTTGPNPALAQTLNLTTDTDGTARAYYRHGSTAAVTSYIQAYSGGQTFQFTTTSVSQMSLAYVTISNSWQMQYFGALGVDPNANPGGDGMSNLYKYAMDLNPLINEGANDADGDGVANNQDARPSDANKGRLSININAPVDGAIVQ